MREQILHKLVCPHDLVCSLARDLPEMKAKSLQMDGNKFGRLMETESIGICHCAVGDRVVGLLLNYISRMR